MWNNFRATDEYRANYEDRASSVVGGLINLLENAFGVFTGEYTSRWNESEFAQSRR